MPRGFGTGTDTDTDTDVTEGEADMNIMSSRKGKPANLTDG